MVRRFFCLIMILGLYLGLQDGYIALWEHGAQTPLQVFTYRAALYPNADQQALRDGIPIESETQLRQILEDFLS